MSDALERVKMKRATVRSLTTKVIQNIDTSMRAQVVNREYVLELFDQLIAKENALKELDKETEDLTPTNELELEIQGSCQYMEYLILWKGRVTRFLEEGNRSRSSSRSSHNQTFQTSNSVKLPRLTVDKYYGDPSQWQNFWGQYVSAIHENQFLSKTEKFNYLKMYLGGTALNSISGLALSDENYDSAISIIKDRFGRKDLVVNSHMSKLLNLTPVKNASDVQSLRRLYDTCDVQIRSLQNMGIVSNAYGSLLCPIFMKVVPSEICLEYSRRRVGDSDWDVSDFLTFFKQEVESRERALILTTGNSELQATTSGNSKNKQQQSKFGATKSTIPSTAALHTSLDKYCVFCNKEKNHKPETCKELNNEEKREKLIQDRRCFICLGPKHMARYCKFRSQNCRTCGKKHHVSICDASVGTEREGGSDGKSDTNTLISAVHRVDDTLAKQETVFLQTIRAMISSKGRDETVRILLDGGSQRTFVQRNISRKLGLEVVGRETLTMHTFGRKQPERVTMNRVQVKLVNTQDSSLTLNVEALEIPTISSAVIGIPSRDIHERMNEMGLQLSDNFLIARDQGLSMGMLIGADYYWQVATGKIERLHEELVAIETKMGWCIQGSKSTLHSNRVNGLISIHKVSLEREEVIANQLRSFWDLESLGIIDKPMEESLENKETLIRFENSVKRTEGRYEVRLPWKSEHTDLADNLYVAQRRFQRLTKSFKSDAQFFEQYREVIESQLSRGIVEKVDEPEISGPKVYYLPHHGVIKQDRETTKLRVVFDGSSKERDCLSLNDCLLTGPNLNPDLFTLLLKFRLK